MCKEWEDFAKMKPDFDFSWDCDVLVAGGGIAGVAAALAAARQGARTLLIEREYALGGLATLGMIVEYLPLCDGKGKQVCFGIAEELLRLSLNALDGPVPDAWLDPAGSLEERRKTRYQTRFNAPGFALLCERLLLSAGVTVRYGVQLGDAETMGDDIVSVRADSRTERGLIRARAFVDATGDAVLCHRAGASVRLFKQQNILASWYMSLSKGKAELHILGCADVPEDQRGEREGPVLLSDRRYQGLDTAEVSDFVQASHAYLYRHWQELRERDPGALPVCIPTIPQLRMTRCLDGLTTLDDKQPHRRFPDSVGATGDWRMCGPAFELPYGILCAKERPNLYAAGRCVSVNDAMWDITRVIPPCAVTGQAAGIAAALHAQAGARPDASFVQAKLIEQGAVPHLS